MNDKVIYYATNQELDFIESMGMFSINKQGRKSLLKGYIKAANNRVNWGGIDKDRVVKHAVFCLSKLG